MRLRRECLSRSRRACSFVRWVCIGRLGSGVVCGSGFTASEEKFGPCGTITLQGFSFGSVAEILDASTEDQEDAGEVGFRFGDGYDFGARKAGFAEGLRKGVPDET